MNIYHDFFCMPKVSRAIMQTVHIAFKGVEALVLDVCILWVNQVP